MINIAEYGLIEQDVTRSLFKSLGEVGQQVYCSEMAKTKKRATHCFTYLLGDEIKNVYWTLEKHEIERIADFINRKLGALIDINEMPDTAEKQAGLEAYRLRCIEIKEKWNKRAEQTTESNKGDMSDEGTSDAY